MRCFAMLLLFSAAPVLAGAIRVELIFEGESVRVGRVERIRAPAPVWNGFAQGEELFFEALGPKGQVIYAETLHDPRYVSTEGVEARDEQRPAQPPRARVLVHVPDVPAAREIRVCRRLKGGKSLRQVLGRGSL